MNAVEWLGAVLVVVSVWLIGGLSIRGQWLMLISQGVWLGFALHVGLLGLALQSAILGLMTMRALYVWRIQFGRWW